MSASPDRTIRRLLVANRGEISRRVTRTAHAMGISTVAVFTDVDADAAHVREADAAVRLGDGNPGGYLDAAALVDAARRTGADAVHPGYGFLAESPALARAVDHAGLVWVGPPAVAITTMGDKVAAKRAATDAGVPTLPSAELAGEDPATWRTAAELVGYPLLVKATAGGGGKGMQVVTSADELDDAVRSARRLAESAFGDPRVFAERWVRAARHIEIQVLADRHGNVVHLGERECSIQRRHQKIVEEAPSPALGPGLRAEMGAAAVSLCRAVGYEGAGTVELLLEEPGDVAGDQGPAAGKPAFWFLEMNTRLQVEHPVTEAVTGLDLVRLQLEVAAGRPLELTQDDIELAGHAVEARLYAEDPARAFLPSAGMLHRWRPADVPGVRCDSGVESGSVVTTDYDPLLAKVIARGPTREEATARLARALCQLEVHGVTTNRRLLVAVLDEPDFRAGRTTTDHLERHPDLLAAAPPVELLEHHVLAAVLHGQHLRRTADRHVGFAPSGWGRAPQTVELTVEGRRVHASYERGRGGCWRVELVGLSDPPIRHEVDLASATDDEIALEVDGVRRSARVRTVGATTWVNSPEGQTELVELPRFAEHASEATAGGPAAPVPGTVVRVEVGEGDEVAPGQTLVVLEAMKMEHRIEAHEPARVVEVLVRDGDTVDAHQQLIRLEEAHVTGEERP